MPATADESSAAPEAAAAPRRTRRWVWWVALAVGVVIVVGLALPLYSTLQPEYYSRYPQLAVRMENWRKSTHAKVACSGCHVDPGPVGFLKFAAKAIPDFYSQLVLGPNSSNVFSTPHTAACQKCHTNYRQVSPNGDLLIPHRAHVAVLKIDCPVCHKNLVHSPNAKGFNAPEMTTCLKCHDGKRASNKCTTCHTRKEVPASHRAKDWLQIHSQKVKTIDCSACHGWSPTYCADCHKQRPASHTATWKADHKGPAKQNPKRCLVCHTEQFCKTCH